MNVKQKMVTPVNPNHGMHDSLFIGPLLFLSYSMRAVEDKNERSLDLCILGDSH